MSDDGNDDGSYGGGGWWFEAPLLAASVPSESVAPAPSESAVGHQARDPVAFVANHDKDLEVV